MNQLPPNLESPPFLGLVEVAFPDLGKVRRKIRRLCPTAKSKYHAAYPPPAAFRATVPQTQGRPRKPKEEIRRPCPLRPAPRRPFPRLLAPSQVSRPPPSAPSRQGLLRRCRGSPGNTAQKGPRKKPPHAKGFCSTRRNPPRPTPHPPLGPCRQVFCIPGGRRAAGRTAAGADGPAVGSRQTRSGCVWLKTDSRAAKVNLENRLSAWPTPGLPCCLPPTCTKAPTPHRTEQLTPHLHQGAYPPPAPDLPCRLPPTCPGKIDQAEIPRGLPPTCPENRPSRNTTLPTSRLPWRLRRKRQSKYHAAYPPPSVSREIGQAGNDQVKYLAASLGNRPSRKRQSQNTKAPTPHPAPPKASARTPAPVSPPVRRATGRALAGKSRRRRVYPQQIVTTRLLYCLQDPFAHLSRLQRI